MYKLLFVLNIALILVARTKTQIYKDVDPEDYSDEYDSADSESNEVYNVTQKPTRSPLKRTNDTSKSYSDEIIPNTIDTNDSVEESKVLAELNNDINHLGSILNRSCNDCAKVPLNLGLDKDIVPKFTERSNETESHDLQKLSAELKSREMYDLEVNFTKTYDGVNSTNANITLGLQRCRDFSGTGSTGASEKYKRSLEEYPYTVSIQRKGSHYATGALLGKRWILTAAGEFYNVRESIKLFRARLGSIDCKKGGTLYPLKRIVIHPYYVNTEPNYDVAMLWTAYPIEYKEYIKPIALTDVYHKVLSAKFLTTYWSRLIYKGKVLPQSANERIQPYSLRIATQTMIPWDKCRYLMQIRNASLGGTTMCLRPIMAHHSVCMPDAGAPLVADDGLWGVTSGWTNPDCETNPGPTVFTRLTSPPIKVWLDYQMHTRVL